MSDSQSQRSALILVVDDEAMNREMLQICLESEGYGVVTARAGEEALDMIASERPDLVITDVRMHGMSGYELCQRLKADPMTQFIPVAIMTGLEGDEEKQRGINAGADDFIDKPLSLPVMLNRIRSLLRIKQLHDDLQTYNTQVAHVLGRYLDESTLTAVMNDLTAGQS